MSIEADIMAAAEKYNGSVAEMEYLYDLRNEFEALLGDRELPPDELTELIKRWTKTPADEEYLIGTYVKS